MGRLGKWLGRELIEVAPAWLFFLFAFGLLALTQSVILREYRVVGAASPEFFIGSLIVAKAVLLCDLVPFVKRLDSRPLIYAVAEKTGIYLVASMLVRHFEHVLVKMRHGSSFAEANHALFQAMDQPRFWLLMTWFAILLFAFCAGREFYRRLGKSRFRELCFSPALPGMSQ